MFKDRTLTYLAPPVRMDADSQSSQNQLLRGFVHKLNNQLAVIEGFCGLLRMNANDLETAENLEHITEASRSSGSLGQKLMVLGGCVRLADQQLNLRQLVSDLALGWKKKAREAGVDFQVRLPESFPDLTGDASRMVEVLNELAKNAWEAASEAQGTAEVELFAPSDVNSDALVVFSNTGPGVPEERWEELVRPFTSTKGAGHFGLGLSLAVTLASLMGMRLGVISSFSSTSVALSVTPDPKQ